MDDLISRQAVLDMANAWTYNFCDPEDEWAAMKEIRDLPSAQPEIVRCKDCKWWGRKDEQSYGYCNAIKHSYYSPHWEIGIYRKYDKDFFCADAERKTYE